MDCSPPDSPVMEFSRQEYWSGCHSLLHGIFLTQRSNLGLLYYRQIPYQLNHQGSPKRLKDMCNINQIISSRPQDQTCVLGHA